MDLEVLVKLGERLGYEDDDLRTFVEKERRRLEAKQEQDLHRDERRIAREIEAKKIEQEHELETLRLKAQIQEAMVKEAEAPHAPGKFTLLMRLLFGEEPNVVNFIDDILIHTETWEQHVEVLARVFSILRDGNLAARPTKCFFGFKNIEFLGHQVGPS